MIDEMDTVEQSRQEISMLRIQIGKLRQQLSSEEEKKFKSIQLLKNTKTRILTLEQENVTLTSSCRELETKVVSLQREIMNKDSDIAQLLSHLQTVTLPLQGSGASDEKLERELEQTEQTLQEMSRELESLKLQNSKLQVLEFTRDEREEEINKLKLEIIGKVDTIRLLHSEISILKVKLEESLKMNEIQVEELREELEEIPLLREEITNLKQELLKVQDSSVEEKESLGEYKTKYEESLDLLQDLKTRQLQLSNINRSLKEEVRKLSKSSQSSPCLSRNSSGYLPGNPLFSLQSSWQGENKVSEKEYLKIVFLKFLELKDKKSLIPVLGNLLGLSVEELENVKVRFS